MWRQQLITRIQSKGGEKVEFSVIIIHLLNKLSSWELSKRITIGLHLKIDMNLKYLYYSALLQVGIKVCAELS